ncbi:MAG TPA: LacI family DNA-binding transcriptional regulator [Woeseiaceae bacterium]|jgi:LacI family repressor for deo operon, udp, cdd, tsx, nupC, and nupG|nr:LacI family DNA-binding transcriptional regulator [Woeseiaceae bacterium]
MARVGIKQIAARAGVSIATVSHALRNPGRVSEATRSKVLAAAEAVGYTPNNLAVSLRTARSGNIVAIIPDVADSYNSGIIKAIEKVAHRRGYSVLLGDTQGSPEREREFAAMTRSRQADGIILMSHRLPFVVDGKRPAAELPPLVNGCEFTGCDAFPTVSVDDIQAAVDATNHLIEYGHRQIAIITGDMNSTSSKDRVTGFRRAMEEAGLPCNERLIVYGEYTVSCGESATEKLLLQRERPTAIFCFSDEIALGCMYALRQHRFGVPEDISVIGFDDIPFAKYFAPPLTTVAQPVEDIGATCATILLDLIDGKRPEKMRRFLHHRLVVRESTRPLP